MALKRIVKEHGLLISIIIAVLFGCIIGTSCHNTIHSMKDPASARRIAMYMKFPGELFIRMLKMIVVPLVMSSIIVSLSEIALSSVGRLGKRTFIYYVLTSFFSSLLGLILALIIKPGKGVFAETKKNENTSQRRTIDNILDLMRNAFPDNIAEALFTSVFTKDQIKYVNYQFVSRNISDLVNVTAEKMAAFLQNSIIIPNQFDEVSNSKQISVINKDVIHEFGGLSKGGGTNMIGLIVFSITLGIVLNILKDEGKPLLEIFRCLWKSMMKFVDIIMWLSPLGIASIVAANIVETKEVSSMFKAAGLLLATNISGYFLQALFLYPTMYFIAFRKFPFTHIKHILPALVTAIGTNSSAATLPTTIDCCEKRAKLNQTVARFVLPIGATCNMDGSALYFAIIVPFIDQIEPGVSLDTGDLILTIFLATLLSIGAAGIPSPGLTNTIIILEATGLPIGKLGPAFAIEWFNGRIQTSINVMGDTYAAAIIEKLSEDELNKEQCVKEENYEDK